MPTLEVLNAVQELIRNMSILMNNSFRLFVLIVLYIVGMALIPLLLYLPLKYPLFIVIYTIAFPFALIRYYMLFIDFILRKVLKIEPRFRRRNDRCDERSRTND